MKVALLLFSTLLSAAAGYQVLVVVPTPSRSHGALAKGIVNSLLDAGHQVTWVTPYSDWKPHKNLRLIKVATEELIKGIDMTQRAGDGLTFVKQFATNITLVTMQSKEVQDTVVKDNYDAIVTEWFFSDTDAGFAAVQQAPWIVLSGMVLMPNLEGMVDDVRSISTVPIAIHDFSMPMSFFERVVNTVTFVAMWATTLLETSSTAARYESLFGPLAAARGVPLPAFSDALYNVSIMLVNSDPILSHALVLPPNVVHIGGYHIEEAQPLPQDIQQILDSSPQGVIFFSMGSVVKSTVIPVSVRRQLIAMFAELPHTVLWKFEEELPGLPKNIVVRKWWPQSAVLKHPNVKLFITHGGMLSTTEAIHYGVPLLAVPIFGDQPSNAARAVRAGYALSVPYSETMGPELKKTLKEMLSTERYYNQAKYLSKIFNKRPVTQSKLISHYIELAIESRGAYHLRSKSHHYPWYQRWFLDQLAGVLLIVYVLYSAIRRLGRQLLPDQKGKKVKRN